MTTVGQWVWLHVGLFLLGYAALFITFSAAVMYLIQERELKSKKPRAFYYRLPPLTKLDQVGNQTLAFGFVCVTLGLIIASVVLMFLAMGLIMALRTLKGTSASAFRFGLANITRTNKNFRGQESITNDKG